MQAPRHSVLLPVYQGEHFLEEALASIAAQNCDDVEVLAVDDGSTDRSPGILQAWRSRLPLRILHPESGGNWMAATNHGLRAATGTWISFLHQDDRWRPDRLRVLDAAIREHPAIRFHHHPVELIDPRGRSLGVWRSPWPTGRPLSATDVLPRYATQNVVGIPAPCFHRDLLQTAPSLREDLWFLADWDFWIRLIHAAGGLYSHEPALASFRIHPHSQTATRSGDEADLRRQFQAVRERMTFCLGGTHPRPLASRVNEDLAITLAAWSHRRLGHPWRTLGGLLRLGPRSWPRFWRETRLGERVAPRLRVALGNARRTNT